MPGESSTGSSSAIGCQSPPRAIVDDRHPRGRRRPVPAGRQMSKPAPKPEPPRGPRSRREVGRGRRHRHRTRGRRGQLPHATHQLLGIERLLQVAIGATAHRLVGVEALERADEQQHGHRGIELLRAPADLETVGTRHVHVGDDHIRLRLAQARDRLRSVRHRSDVEVLVHEGQFDHLLDGHAVVSQENRLRHCSSESLPGRLAHAAGDPLFRLERGAVRDTSQYRRCWSPEERSGRFLPASTPRHRDRE